MTSYTVALNCLNNGGQPNDDVAVELVQVLHCLNDYATWRNINLHHVFNLYFDGFVYVKRKKETSEKELPNSEGFRKS